MREHADEPMLVVKSAGVTNITANDDGHSCGHNIDGMGYTCVTKESGPDTKGKITASPGVGGVLMVTGV